MEVQNGNGSRIFDTCVFSKDDRSLSIYAPTADGQVIEIPPKVNVKVGLAASDAYYSFTTQVLKSNNVPEYVLVLDKPKVIYRSQRRQHPRLPIKIAVGYRIWSEDDAQEPEIKEGFTRDLSLGGVSLVIPEHVAPGEILAVELRPKSESDVVEALAQVLRSKPVSDQDGEGFVLGCSFTRVDSSIQKLLGH